MFSPRLLTENFSPRESDLTTSMPDLQFHFTPQATRIKPSWAAGPALSSRQWSELTDDLALHQIKFVPDNSGLGLIQSQFLDYCFRRFLEPFFQQVSQSLAFGGRYGIRIPRSPAGPWSLAVQPFAQPDQVGEARYRYD